ncbi:MAG: type VII secretion protein EssC [Peptococcaceae bacterium]|nr:type VII secretion protein EssC [Peptococcaceae bacterium]
MARPILVADYGDVRYLCPIAQDRGVYSLSADIAADVCIPQYTASLEIVTETDENGVLKRCEIHRVDPHETRFAIPRELREKKGLRDNDGAAFLHTEERKVTQIDGIRFHVEYHYDDYVEIYLENEETMHFGNHADNQIVLANCANDFTFVLVNTEQGWELHPFPNVEPIYINRTLCRGDRPNPLRRGDIVHFAGYVVEMKGVSCTLFHQKAYIRLYDLTFYRSPEEVDTRYPYFKRPPRKLYPQPTEKIGIPNPPNPPQEDRFGLLLRLAPMAGMVVVMITMSIVLNRGLFMLMAVGGMVITGIVTIVRFVKDKKKKKTDEAERHNFYQDLLNRKRKEIRGLMAKQRQAVEMSYPNPEDCLKLAAEFSPRLFERAPEHADFFRVRIGTGHQPLSFSINYSTQETKEAAKDPLAQEAEELAAKYKGIPALPQSISLQDAYVGIVGPQELTMPHMLSLIMNFAIFHSYNDISLVAVYTKRNEKNFLPLKWLPHTWVGDRQFKGMVKDEATRDNVLDSLYHLVKDRETTFNQKDQHSGKTVYQPLLFVVADMGLVYDHLIMDYLSKDHRHLGVYAIFVDESEYALPESVKTLLTLIGPGEATLYQETDPRPRPYAPDTLDRDAALLAARALAPVQHVEKSASKALPESVTLFELFQIEAPDQLDVWGKWRSNRPYQTLAVPIGLRAADKTIELNLHEKAHGPHGLLAGTTGSGKSETLQSYILSLAIHFHPYEVAFLLIDYKGGGMANLFDKLPHLLGVITNLDGAQSMRALVAIKSEMRRRQGMLGHHGLNHVDAYQKLRAQESSLAPMPHLFIISDEFAELKREQPDFIKELVSAARIGRSLGVHLILATQKPSGVVDDQIWSNSNFRVCLKVQNVSDSNEMLKTPDAAHITLPGRGYLQVGNNVIYEQFQSAYSGAEYKAGRSKDEEKPDANIYLWNELGQAQLLTKDFSTIAAAAGETTEANPVTQLDAVVNTIERVFGAAGLRKVPSPWLPPLRERIYLPDLLENSDFVPRWGRGQDEQGNRAESIEVIAGMVDEIERQRQSPLTINFSADGHVGVFGSPGSGKSTLLRSIAMNLALDCSPEQINFFILDFGNNALLPLRNLPHTADALVLDQTEALGKLERLLNQEMKRRKDLLGEAGVGSIPLLNTMNRGKRLFPILFIFVDNLDALKDQARLETEALIRDISRDGQALGIYLIFSASRPGVVRQQIMANINQKFIFYVNEKAEIAAAVGRTDLKSEQIPGRGLMRKETICIFQAALPAYGATEMDQIQNFLAAIEVLQKAWQGPRPRGVPMMPALLTWRDFCQVPGVLDIWDSNDNRLPVALDDENVEAFALDFGKISHINMTGVHNIGKTNFMKILFESLARKRRSLVVTAVDDDMLKLSGYKDRCVSYLTKQEEFSVLLQVLVQEVKDRKEAYIGRIKAQETRQTPAEFYATLKHHLVIVNNVANFIGKLTAKEKDVLAQLIDESQLTGVHFCFVSNLQDFPRGTLDRLPGAIRSINAGFTFIPLKESQMLPVPVVTARPKELAPGEAYFIYAGSALRVKFPYIA